RRPGQCDHTLFHTQQFGNFVFPFLSEDLRAAGRGHQHRNSRPLKSLPPQLSQIVKGFIMKG
ncbi:hypothetical protein L9F63_016417, partial [Diploptera punctata]